MINPIPQGFPLATQPIQQVPLGVAVVEERVVSSSSSLEEEIDKFQFEEEETQWVEASFILEAEEETYRLSCVQAPTFMITYLEDSSDDEVEEMTPKFNQSLRELMKGRNKVSTPQEANKSKPLVNPPPPLPQLPTDLGLKPVPDLGLRTNEVKGPLLLRAERGLSQLTCTVYPAYGPLGWS